MISPPGLTPPESSSPVYEETWLPGPDETPFYTRTYLPPVPTVPRAVVLFVHGFADHITRHERDHAAWVKRGITLFAYDQRGFGRTALGVDGARKVAYGRTDARRVEEDLAWWVGYVARRWVGVPVFLTGYSAVRRFRAFALRGRKADCGGNVGQGGGFALAFCTKPKWAEYVGKLSGVIALSPLFVLTHPASPVLFAAVKMLDYVAPNMAVPAPMPEERFSRDPAVAPKLRSDPLRKAQATPRSLISMFAECRTLLDEGWKSWPKGLPVIAIHGKADEVNSCDATVEWFDKVEAQNKKLVLIEGAYHDLVNEIEDIPERVSNEYMGWVETHL
ncbi:hypothetical protein EIP86_007997 [Pleurotus ostreatoroseus]|nr:hypothetical protein EIP86_007997 [Pleurotus ostreatoroseus]